MVKRLGISSVAYVALYRLQLKSGVMKKRFPQGKFENKHPILNLIENSSPKIDLPDSRELIKEADEILENQHRFFCNDPVSVDKDQWHKLYNSENPRVVFNEEHWSESYSLLKNGEDVKLIWETSRFYWLLVLIRAYRSSGDKKYFDKANELLTSWRKHNPLNTGINWACAQEASYRVIHLLTSQFLLGNRAKVEESLLEFIREHLKRIEGVLGYGVAQKNNHGTTESTALYIGGAWLEKNSSSSQDKKFGTRCKKKGRKTLENLTQELIQKDGSFSMYSTNYHRVVMQTLSFALFAMKELKEPEFGQSTLKKIEDLLVFLESLCDEQTGRVPATGTNDGSYLMKLNAVSIGNFNPCCEVLRALLKNKITQAPEKSEDLYWLGLQDSPQSEKPSNDKINFPNFGLVKLKNNRCQAFLKYPSYQFRPSQSDIGHLELWLDGKTVIADSGTYSYGVSGKDWDFGEEEHHNALVVENNPKMKKISPFLYGDWPKEGGGLSGEMAYSQYKEHFQYQRQVRLNENGCVVEDTFKAQDEVSYRWKLSDNDWEIEDERTISSGSKKIKVTGDIDLSIRLEKNWISPNYQRKETVQVLIVESPQPKGMLKTSIEW